MKQCYENGFDVLVVGGGHAGVEAAAAAARIGVQVGLITLDAATVGAMSCNPAIGGIGKGHLVRELDAFDGLMAVAADQAAVHYRMLNRSKGVAVHGPRIQADRSLFKKAIQNKIGTLHNLTVIEGEAEELILDGDRVCGLELSGGVALACQAIVLATGTFLGGRLHRGAMAWNGGRVGEAGAHALAKQLRSLDLPIARMKTGTPPRLDGRSIDWSRLEVQESDQEAWTFSPMSVGRALPQVVCAVAHSSEKTHGIIREKLRSSSLYGGHIEGRGPRYCPSIEDKVVRFSDRDSHQIFLEPEGLDDRAIYPNGLSTSLPVDVQQEMVRSIEGLEQAVILQPGYAVEYDHIDPRALDHSLTMRVLPNLFCAGQINGTTGYEEAAAQGLIAGINAARLVRDLPSFVPSRSQSYIGVMIDDLVLQGVTEPYRMLTSRAENRLYLRADNAVTRLGAKAMSLGVVGMERTEWTVDRLDQHRRCTELLQGSRSDVTAEALLEALRVVRSTTAVKREIMDEASADRLYQPYVERQVREGERVKRDGGVVIPPSLCFADVAGLSNEMIERLNAARPADLAQAGRIRGITPVALTAILAATKRMAYARA